MPARKNDTKDRILKAAKALFLQHGFQETSMQEIASAVGISAPGLYKHFESKEAIFSALVDPIIERMREILHLTKERKDDLFEKGQTDQVWDKEETFSVTLDFIYENFDAFKLLVCSAEGTRYENMVDHLAGYETEVILKTLPKLREKGLSVPPVTEETISLMMRNQYRTLAEFIRNDFTKAEAEAYIQAVSTFTTAGWRALFTF